MTRFHICARAGSSEGHHLQNRFYLLWEVSRHSERCPPSTRVVRVAGPQRVLVRDIPVARLVGPAERTMTRVPIGCCLCVRFGPKKARAESTATRRHPLGVVVGGASGLSGDGHARA
jgi:hypothetical protein